MEELTRGGYTSKAYEVLDDYPFPSWLYQVTNNGPIYSGVIGTNYGATTCWERWDGFVSRQSARYRQAGYNSFNHFWSGSVGEWIFRNIGGIAVDEDNPGYQKVIIRPQPGGGITTGVSF